MTKIINLFGGPGVGKSTTAALVYANMKEQGYKVELVREVAKELLYRRWLEAMRSQMYILNEQEGRLTDILYAEERHRPDYIVTDSPLLLGVVYCNGDRNMETIIADRFNLYDNVNFLLTRNFPYATDGRREDERSAVQVHRDVERLLAGYPHYKVLAGDAYDIITCATLDDRATLILEGRYPVRNAV